MDYSVFVNEDIKTQHSSQAVRRREEAFQAQLAERRECLRARDAVGSVRDPTGPPSARRWAIIIDTSGSCTIHWAPPLVSPSQHQPRQQPQRRRRLAQKALPAPGSLAPILEDVSPPSPPSESLEVPIEYELEHYFPCVLHGRNAADEDVDDNEDAVTVAVQGPLPPSPSSRWRQNQGMGPWMEKLSKKTRVSLVLVCFLSIYICMISLCFKINLCSAYGLVTTFKRPLSKPMLSNSNEFICKYIYVDWLTLRWLL